MPCQARIEEDGSKVQTVKTSAKTGANVSQGFEALVDQMMNDVRQRTLKSKATKRRQAAGVSLLQNQSGGFCREFSCCNLL